MGCFSDEKVDLEILKERAYNMRWAEVEDGIIPLTAADSDFPACDEVISDIIDYVKKGYFSYTPKLGLDEFKISFVNALKKRKNVDICPEEVLPIDSAARGMSVIAKAFLNPGDEAIVFDPVDFLFKTSMEAAGAKIILFPTKIVDGKIDFSDLESYITPKTKMLGLCNPHNPLGMVYPMEDLAKILDLSEKYGFYIMNDEIWSDIVYSDKKFNSILELGPEKNKNTLSVYGFSKSFGMAGLRIGCVYTQNKVLFDKIVEASEVMSTIGGIPSISQIAGKSCCDRGYEWFDKYLKHLEGNRDYAMERIKKMPKVTCVKPDATFVLFPNISALEIDPVEFVEYLRKKHKVYIVPGGDRFFGPGSNGHVRICLATSREILTEGLNRIERGINELVENNKLDNN